MSAESGQLERIEAELRAIRAEVRQRLVHPEPGSYTLGGAARYLGVSRRTVARMVAGQQLLTVTIGSQPRIPASELKRLLTPGRTTPAMPELGQRPRKLGRRRGAAGSELEKMSAGLRERQRRRRPPTS